METRLAIKTDLAELKTMFDKIVKVMESNKVFIWNEYYPYEEFENDIQNKNLYVTTENDKIISAFGLLIMLMALIALNGTIKMQKLYILEDLGLIQIAKNVDMVQKR